MTKILDADHEISMEWPYKSKAHCKLQAENATSW